MDRAGPEAVRKRLSETYVDAMPSTLVNWAGQIDAFRDGRNR